MNQLLEPARAGKAAKTGRLRRECGAIRKDFQKNRHLYLMILPVLAYFVIFHYWPMYGAQIAFKDFSPGLGISGSPWVGFKHFKSFFTGIYFGRLVGNTLKISLSTLCVGFPAAIILALLLNEIRCNVYKRLVQTVSYLPYFISIMVVCGLVLDFTSQNGLINDVVELFGGERVSYMLYPKYFVPVYVASGVWQNIGWNSIVYLAALAAVDPQLYEAATIDGAGKLRQTWSVTLPGILPTIVIMLIMRIGQLMNVGFEKIILLYNPNIYETADVISSFVYRKGLMEFSYSFSTAVGLFNSLINFLLLCTANFISRKCNETSLW
ncbi:MAG: sugar ABC transporter permease [Provencibacterium sp.]|nr:sugar ABC transporter permease [Provencibacterium sp.]